MIVENLPAWNAHIRSSATLRSASKWHFADPSPPSAPDLFPKRTRVWIQESIHGAGLDVAFLFGDSESVELESSRDNPVSD